jgi:hypothetical protein
MYYTVHKYQKCETKADDESYALADHRTDREGKGSPSGLVREGQSPDTTSSISDGESVSCVKVHRIIEKQVRWRNGDVL